MTQVTDPQPATDFRVQRARQLRERQLNRAAIAQAAPDATEEEQEDLLRSLDRSEPRSESVSVDSAHLGSTDESQPAVDPVDRPAWFRRLVPWWPRLSAMPAHEESTTDALIMVARPGRPIRKVGRGRSWVTRLALIIGPILMIGGLAYSCGVSTGSSRLVQQAAISSQDAAAYHLSSFPAARASAFGVAYLTVCLTHPPATDTVATQNRVAALAQMTSAGVSTGCGWTGTAASSAPLAVTWDGSATPIQSGYADGAAAQLGFVVTTVDQRRIGMTVPIWMPSTTSTAGARVVGDVAVVPVATAAAAPTPIAPAVTDSASADALTRSVLVPFLRAWAASDSVQLNLVLARDASSAARTGMSGQVSGPTVSGVRVVVNRGDPSAYRDGDQVTAQVTVDWTTASGGQRAGYSIGLRMTAGRWQVTDISGAATDPAGGLAPSTTFATPTSAAPTAG